MFSCGDFTPIFCAVVNDTGTAGVWRISALNEAGGWKDRTTVEDMDLAVRASLKGWKFLYLANLKVLFFFFFLIRVVMEECLYTIWWNVNDMIGLLCGVGDSDELVWHEFITWKTGEKWTTKYSEGLQVPTAQVVLWTSQSFPENGDGDNEEQGKVAPLNWQDKKYWLFMTKILVCVHCRKYPYGRRYMWFTASSSSGRSWPT